MQAARGDRDVGRRRRTDVPNSRDLDQKFAEMLYAVSYQSSGGLMAQSVSQSRTYTVSPISNLPPAQTSGGASSDLRISGTAAQIVS